MNNCKVTYNLKVKFQDTLSVWKVSKYRENTGKYGPEETPSLDTFHPVTSNPKKWFIKGFTAQKMKFSIKDFSSKCDQIRSFLWQFSVDWVIFTGQILNGKLHFLYSVFFFYLHDCTFKWIVLVLNQFNVIW